MKYLSLIVVGSTLLLVGGGCSSISQRYTPEPVAASTSTAVIQPPDFSEAEYFVRSRDDVKPGQADVNQQSLFVKTIDGQTIELIADVHTALEGKLLESSFLILQKDIPAAGPYIYFVNDLGDSSIRAHQLFAFDKESKKFVTLPVTLLTESQNLSDFQYSPDHTKLAVLRSEPEESQVVYIVDLKTGQVTNRYGVADKMTMTDPASSDLQPVVAVNTKWTDNKLFQVALFKRTQVSNGKNVPDDVVVIDTSRVLSADDLLKAEYTYDFTLDVLFARPISEDASVVVVTAVGEKLTPSKQAMGEDGDVAMFEGVNTESPFVFFTGPGYFGYQYFAGIYDKKSGKFLTNSPLIGKPAYNAVLSKSGKRLATFEESSEGVVNVQLVDVMTLQIIKKVVETQGLFLSEKLTGKIDSESFGTNGPNKWSDEKTLVVYLYKAVDVQKYADKDGKFSVTRPLAKTITLKFE